jgi:hypothetical protein
LPRNVERISRMGRKQIWQPEWFGWVGTILDSGAILNLAHSRMWGSCQLEDGRVVFVAIADRTWRVCKCKRIVSRGEGPESLGFYLRATTNRLGSTVRESRRVRQIRDSDGSALRHAMAADERQPNMKRRCIASTGTAVAPAVSPAAYLTDDSSNYNRQRVNV